MSDTTPSAAARQAAEDIERRYVDAPSAMLRQVRSNLAAIIQSAIDAATAELTKERDTLRAERDEAHRMEESLRAEVERLTREIKESLTRFTPLRAAILQPASCGVSGHFKFQENGGHCSMCQAQDYKLSQLQDALAAAQERVEQLQAACVVKDKALELTSATVEALAHLPCTCYDNPESACDYCDALGRLTDAIDNASKPDAGQPLREEVERLRSMRAGILSLLGFEATAIVSDDQLANALHNLLELPARLAIAEQERDRLRQEAKLFPWEKVGKFDRAREDTAILDKLQSLIRSENVEQQFLRIEEGAMDRSKVRLVLYNGRTSYYHEADTLRDALRAAMKGAE